MILNQVLGNSDRIEIIEVFLNNVNNTLSTKDIETISEVHNIQTHIHDLQNIGIIIKEKNNEYKLNTKDKRVICLRYINNYEFTRQLKEVYNDSTYLPFDSMNNISYSENIKPRTTIVKFSSNTKRYAKLGVCLEWLKMKMKLK